MKLAVAILAGGLAARLGNLTGGKPKSLVEVAGKPFILHQLELLRRNGVKRIVLCVGYRGEQIERIVGDGAALGVEVVYSYDGPQLLGTGGALRKALPLLGETFLVLYGDSYLECDYAAFERALLDSNRMGLMTVLRNEGRWDASNVLFRDGKILAYDKARPLPEMRHIDYGLGGLRAAAFELFGKGGQLDLAELYRCLLARGELGGYEVSQRFYEIGSPAGLAETRAYLEAKGDSSRG